MQMMSALAKDADEVTNELDQRKVSEGGYEPVAMERQKQIYWDLFRSITSMVWLPINAGSEKVGDAGGDSEAPGWGN